MELAIELFGFLIFAILGFVAPIVAILLSIFQEGMPKLAKRYQGDIFQSEDNLKTIAKAKEIDSEAIKQSVKELESTKKRAENKLSYLNPKKQILRLFIPLVFAFLAIVATSILIEVNIYYALFLLISLASFIYALIILWNLIGIIVEAREAIDVEKKVAESGTRELLTSLAQAIDRTGQYFLKNVYIAIDGQYIKDDSHETTIPVNTKKEVKITLYNSEPRMAKNVEIGFRFPLGFIIDKTDYYSIGRDERCQVVRYSQDIVHGNTYFDYSHLIITPLEKGKYQMRTFIKAENIESTYREVTINVI